MGAPIYGINRGLFNLTSEAIEGGGGVNLPQLECLQFILCVYLHVSLEIFPSTGPILGKLNQMYGNALFTTFFQGFRVIIVLLKLVMFRRFKRCGPWDLCDSYLQREETSHSYKRKNNVK